MSADGARSQSWRNYSVADPYEHDSMPNITEVKNADDKDRVYVWVDGSYCCSIRTRTWKAIELSVGSEISCEELQERESFFWKNAYGQKAWEEEKKRLERVKGWIKTYLPSVQVKTLGFGAESTEFIAEHPGEKGDPDLSLAFGGREVIALEVSGTGTQRGQDFWVRPDKLKYAQNHPERDVWIVLHYRKPKERFVWIKPDLSKNYEDKERVIRGVSERYVIFDNNSEEVKSSAEFSNYVAQKVKSLEDIRQ